jgi:hypothetical protein
VELENKRNIEHLFAARKPRIKDNLEDAVIQKAALLFDFDFTKDFSDITETQYELLTANSCANASGRYYLPNHIRRQIILQLVERNQLQNVVEQFQLQNDYVKILVQTIQRVDFKIAELNAKDLFYLHKLSVVLPEYIHEDQVRSIQFELERRQFLQHFNTITKNFAGRREEYNKLKSYVDWLPPSGIKENLVSGFRNLINWHDKKPMLITGIGGIGKSTLISKFILDHVSVRKNEQKLPFIYIDFDLIGFSISEPLNIFIEALRQLSLQFPHNRKVFQRVSEYISANISRGTSIVMSSSEGSRSIMLDEIKSFLPNFESDLNTIKTPILVVFDSFEELQYRANRTELLNFFTTIRQVAEHLPRIRPVFIGRAKIDENRVNTTFEEVELTDFDVESANAILQMYGIEDQDQRRQIFKSFGGNPLTLQLAANIVLHQNMDAIKVKTKNLFTRVEESKIQEQLVSRMLDHIHDAKARKISMPGMMVRKINPQVIKYVLAEPCKLGTIDDVEATAIFFSLEKEAFLLAKQHHHKEFAFRQDLRMACEKMILQKYPEQVAQIHAKAIEYYANETAPENVAEYYFHWLKSGNDPNQLAKETYLDIRMYLENSIQELPDAAQLYINQLIGGGVNQKIIDESELLAWESYYGSVILEAFRGELAQLQQFSAELQKRKERTYTTQLNIVEATLYQRLGELDKSNAVIDAAIAKMSKQNKEITYFSEAELLFIKAQNLEYAENYGAAIELLLPLLENTQGTGDFGLLQKGNFLKERLLARITLGSKTALHSMVFSNYDFNYQSVLDINWAFIFSKLMGAQQFTFADATAFKNLFENIKERIHSFRDLESFCHQQLGYFYSEIAISGVFDIAIRDMMYVMEAEGKLSLIS